MDPAHTQPKSSTRMCSSSAGGGLSFVSACCDRVMAGPPPCRRGACSHRSGHRLDDACLVHETRVVRRVTEPLGEDGKAMLAQRRRRPEPWTLAVDDAGEARQLHGAAFGAFDLLEEVARPQ